ncbi:MAG: hypothetical protein EBR82_72040 [Caulobacteraceae bacterium]|nr:hypothetical protein [Caulobacteraceae bacterium]
MKNEVILFARHPISLGIDLELIRLRRQNALAILAGLYSTGCTVPDAETVAEEYRGVVKFCEGEIQRITALLGGDL